MKKDIPVRKVEDILIAIVPSLEKPDDELWGVYLINLKPAPITNVLISSKGYGSIEGQEVKTSVLRHFFDEVKGGTYQQIEQIQSKVFSLNNEFWLSFSFDKFLYDKRFTFVAGSISEENFTQVPILGRQGVMIG
jgi:hypothetical protein